MLKISFFRYYGLPENKWVLDQIMPGEMANFVLWAQCEKTSLAGKDNKAGKS